MDTARGAHSYPAGGLDGAAGLWRGVLDPAAAGCAGHARRRAPGVGLLCRAQRRRRAWRATRSAGGAGYLAGVEGAGAADGAAVFAGDGALCDSCLAAGGVVSSAAASSARLTGIGALVWRGLASAELPFAVGLMQQLIDLVASQWVVVERRKLLDGIPV